MDPFSCVLGDLFGIPVISVFDAYNPVCKNVISMRPDTAQLHNATLELIRKFRSRVVAVIIQGKFTLFLIIHGFLESLHSF